MRKDGMGCFLGGVYTCTFRAVDGDCRIAVCEEDRFGLLQPTILVGVDINQLESACGEIKLGFYDALGAHVMSRMMPANAFALVPPSSRFSNEAE